MKVRMWYSWTGQKRVEAIYNVDDDETDQSLDEMAIGIAFDAVEVCAGFERIE